MHEAEQLLGYAKDSTAAPGVTVIDRMRALGTAHDLRFLLLFKQYSTVLYHLQGIAFWGQGLRVPKELL